MLLVDGSGAILNSNRAAAAFLGTTPEKLIGTHLRSLVGNIDSVADLLRSSSRSKTFVPTSAIFKKADGTLVPCACEGAVYTPRADSAPAVVLLRIANQDSAANRFIALNLKIEELSHEVQRRRAAESAAHAQSSRLRVTLASIGDAVIATDNLGHVTLMNSVAEALTGWSFDEAQGRPLDDVFVIVNEMSGAVVESPVTRVLRERCVVGLANHTVLIARDGSRRPIDDSGAPIIDDAGMLIGVILVFHDITDRKQLEDDARRSRDQLQKITDAMPALISYVDAEGRYRFNNKAYEDWFGYKREEILGKHLREVLGEEAFERLRPRVDAALAGQRLHFEGEVTYKDGGARFIRAEYVPDFGADGSVAGYFALINDISDRRRSELALLRSEQRLRSIFDQTLAGIAETDLNGRFVHVNEQYCQIVGRSVEQLYGLRMHDITHPDDLHLNAEMFVALVQGAGEAFTIEKRYVRPDGSNVTVSNSVSLIRDEHGHPQYVAAVSLDISERKQVEDRLRQLAAELSEGARRKDEFLAMLAHELRNPLAPISNAVQVLRLKSADSQTVASTSEMMERQLTQLTRLVDDLLEVSRISRGKVVLRTERVAVATIVNDAVEAAQSLLHCMNHKLDVSLPVPPLHLIADSTRLTQVIVNLLSNACKFTDAGGHISLICEQRTDEVAIRVRDNGIGIAADHQQAIFEMFKQINTSIGRSAGGLGIGLTLVKNLVELHGGTVEVHSAGIGHGSEFTVRLPLAEERRKAPRPEQANDKPAGAVSRRVLVVDDNEDSATSLAMVLALNGHQAQTSFDGIQAVETAAKIRPDVILLDIGMPRLNGYEAARKIRMQPWGKQIMLVAVTGWGQDEDRHKSKEAGFDRHLVKPVDHAALLQLLAGSVKAMS